MELKILNTKGKETGREIKLSNNIINTKYNQHAIYLEIKRYLSAQRQGTNQTKVRNEISGSKRKIQRQKGTGNARKGDIHSFYF